MNNHYNPSNIGKCPGACLHVDIPVCGSDGKTYSNLCYLEMAMCQNDPSLTLEHHGECEKGNLPSILKKNLKEL